MPVSVTAWPVRPTSRACARQPEAQGRLQTIFFLTVGLVEAMFFINLAFMALFVFVLGAELIMALTSLPAPWRWQPATAMEKAVADEQLPGPQRAPSSSSWRRSCSCSGCWLKYVIPPINRAMTARQEAIRTQFAELDEAKDAAHEAEEKYKAELADARQTGNKIREEAREQGNEIVADARDKAHQEAERIIENGRGQLRAERQQAVASLRAEVGTLATQLAGRIVGESLEDDDAQQPRGRPVPHRPRGDADGPGRRSGNGRVGCPGREPLMLRAASAEARDALADRLAKVSGDTSSVGEELFGRGRRAARGGSDAPDRHRRARSNPTPRPAWSGASSATQSATRPSTCFRRRRVGAGRHAVTWPTCVERLGVIGTRALSRQGSGRARSATSCSRSVRWSTATTTSAPHSPTRRAARTTSASCWSGVFGSKVQPATLMLVGQAGSGAHGTFDRGLEEFQHLAAEAQEEKLATVHTARELDDSERERLAKALSKQYGTTVHLQVVVDPDVVGGLRVEIGDDIIDGTVSSRLEDAQRKLAG